MHVPGLKVIMPSTPADAKGLLTAAIFDPDPCLFIENMPTYWNPGPAPVAGQRIPLGKANVLRAGSDVTVVVSSSAAICRIVSGRLTTQPGSGHPGTDTPTGRALRQPTPAANPTLGPKRRRGVWSRRRGRGRAAVTTAQRPQRRLRLRRRTWPAP